MVTMKESFWVAGAAALTMHSLIIFACTLGMGRFEGHTQQTPKPHFCVEMVFKRPCEEPRSDQEAAQAPSPTTPRERHLKKAQKKRSPSPTAATPALTLPRSGISHSSPIYAPAPIYPFEARRKKIQGVVVVRLFLTETGKVHNTIPLSPHANPILESAALTAVHEWRFRPGTQIVEIPIEFKLKA